MTTEEKNQNHIEEIYETLSHTYNVYGVFLYGSQNYGTDTEQSDVDAKAIIVPSFHELVLKKPVSQ